MMLIWTWNRQPDCGELNLKNGIIFDRQIVHAVLQCSISFFCLFVFCCTGNTNNCERLPSIWLNRYCCFIHDSVSKCPVWGKTYASVNFKGGCLNPTFELHSEHLKFKASIPEVTLFYNLFFSVTISEKVGKWILFWQVLILLRYKWLKYLCAKNSFKYYHKFKTFYQYDGVNFFCTSFQGVLFVYDISNQQSFDNLFEWLASIKEITKGMPCHFALVGNKGMTDCEFTS